MLGREAQCSLVWEHVECGRWVCTNNNTIPILIPKSSNYLYYLYPITHYDEGTQLGRNVNTINCDN